MMLFVNREKKEQQINEKGFTLVELVVTIVIGLIVVTFVSAFFINEKKLYESQNQIIDMQQDLRTSLSLMTTEIRMAGYNPLNSSDFAVEKAIHKTEANEIIFLADFNDNGTLETASERIRYALNADGALCRAVGDDTALLYPIAENVENFNLNYIYDSPASTEKSDLRHVQITLTVKSDDVKRNIYNEIKCRNLGIKQ
ncbi:MAG: prepilin-type N-terminal cleavage/methylation domain-containing protein [Desulforegulaceae bacterium]|jgi:type IV pilus assembly protein PilW|nr:prepilin-type N-terminal cleavage/methylation domain-containing protein [Desulforegulaceae bacterium]